MIICSANRIININNLVALSLDEDMNGSSKLIAYTDNKEFKICSFNDKKTAKLVLNDIIYNLENDTKVYSIDNNVLNMA